MELCGEKLTFGNKNQRLVCQRLAEEKKILMRPKILALHIKDEDKLTLVEIVKEIEEISHIRDKYIKALRTSKVTSMLETLINPILNQKRIAFEQNFNYWIKSKRGCVYKTNEKKVSR